VNSGRIDDALDELPGVERLGAEVDPAGIELVGEQDLIDDASEAL
jgi:hypothetical protein